MSPRDEHGDELRRWFGNTPARVEPSADMREAARQVRGLYVALTDEGFSRTDALYLVAKAMTQGKQS